MRPPRPALRLFGAVVFVYLAVLAGAGLELGLSAARGPGGTVASELTVDGCVAEGTGGPVKTARQIRKRLPRADGDLSFRVARSVQEVEGLRAAWAELQGPHFTSDIDVFLAMVEHAPGVLRPHVLVAEADGEPVALVAARLEDARLPARLGYVRVSPRLRMLTVSYGGLMTRRPDDTAALLDELRRSLRGERVDVVRLRMLEVGSAEHAAATRWAGTLRRRRFAPALLHWRCAIPASYDEFLAARSKERRRHVRRYQRRLEEAFQDDLEVCHFTSRAELDRLFADTERVQQRTYQRALGVGFADTELSRHLTGLAMDKGWFRGAVLYLGGEPAAFWHGNAYRGNFGTTFTGYDPGVGEHRPGTFLLMRLVESLCADPEVHTLGFGFGDADYKRSFGERSVTEEDVVAFEPRPKPLAVNAATSVVLGVGALARGALSRSGALRAARRTWRRRLRRGRDGIE